MKVYRIWFEGVSESEIVEAETFSHALQLWHDAMREELEDDYDPDYEPDMVELLGEGPVIRP